MATRTQDTNLMKTIQKTLLAAMIATAAFAAAPSQASAAWTCGARSATGGWGVGWAPSLWRAKRIALRQCAINTPRGYWCRVVRCV
jgi:hypothetical protein